MPEFASLTIFLLGSLLASVSFLLYQERQKYKDLLKDTSFEEARKQNAAILHQAARKAEDLIEKAEKEGKKVVDSSKLSVDKFESFFEGQFSKQTETAQAALDKYLADLRAQNDKAQLLSADYTKEKVAVLLERFESELEAFRAQVEAKSTQSIEADLAAARQMIENYKKQQMGLIDENIVALMEKALSLVLIQKLSLKEHLDLVYEALEKAKAEKLVV